MNAAPAPTPTPDPLEIERMRRLHAAQSAAFAAHPYPPLAERRAKLRALRSALRRHADGIAAAIDADFGGRCAFETTFADVVGPVLEARHAESHLRRWMRPRRRRTELVFLGNRAEVTYQPKGVVGIIAPWNFPLYLALGPLVAALAAGNRALIKMSEHTPRTTETLRLLLAECFPEDEVAVCGGELAAAQAFAALPFDHLVFTGSPAVAPHVMRAAAANLTPVTLELGGKSPAIVAPGADLAAAATSIAHGKAFNCGQICVSPDYALVPAAAVDRFANAVADAFRRLYPSVAGNPEYTAVVNERQYERLLELLADARAKGARVLVVGEAPSATNHAARATDAAHATDAAQATGGTDAIDATDAIRAPPGAAARDRRLPLHVLTNVRDDMRVAREELFGPVLPVIGYERVDDAIRYVAARPRPLALYPFGFEPADLDRLLQRTHSGGVTVNEWGWHVFNHDLPFGGTGPSGMGTYHGEEGFRELSHAKAVFRKRSWFPVRLFYPPYGSFLQRLVVRLYLGRE